MWVNRGVGRRRPGGALERNENYKTTLCNHWRDNKVCGCVCVVPMLLLLLC